MNPTALHSHKNVVIQMEKETIVDKWLDIFYSKFLRINKPLKW